MFGQQFKRYGILELVTIIVLLIRFTSDSWASSSVNTVIGVVLVICIFLNLLNIGIGDIGGSAGIYMTILAFLLFHGLWATVFDRDLSIHEYFRVLYLYLFFLLLMLIKKGPEYCLFVERLILFSSFLLCSIGIYNHFAGSYSIIEGTARLNGTYAHPNPYGMHLIMVVCFCIYAIAKDRGLWYLALIFLCMAVFSRISNFSAILAMLAFLMFFAYCRSLLNFKNIFYVASFGLVAFVSLFFVSDVLVERIMYFMETGLVPTHGYAENSLQWRFMNWEYYINSIEYPFFGHGAGATDLFYKDEHGTVGFSVLAPHNEFVKLLFEYGYFGVAIFAFVIFHAYRKLSCIGFSFFIAFSMACFFDNFFKATSLLILFGLIVSYFESKEACCE